MGIELHLELRGVIGPFEQRKAHHGEKVGTALRQFLRVVGSKSRDARQRLCGLFACVRRSEFAVASPANAVLPSWQHPPQVSADTSAPHRAKVGALPASRASERTAVLTMTSCRFGSMKMYCPRAPNRANVGIWPGSVQVWKP